MEIKKDTWVWGNETIVWGYHPEHKYTFKILEPKVGRPGCLSLQYHNQKSESWLQLRGESWILVCLGNKVCTKIMKPGDIQNLPTGVIHRLMAVTADCQVAEPSTPDAHAADKNAPKDVIRLACVHGRECSAARNSAEEQLVKESILISESAIKALEAGQRPEEINTELLQSLGSFNCFSMP
jgi:hypothetical protein